MGPGQSARQRGSAVRCCLAVIFAVYETHHALLTKRVGLISNPNANDGAGGDGGDGDGGDGGLELHAVPFARKYESML